MTDTLDRANPLDTDDYPEWLAEVLPGYCRARLAPHHGDLWEWVWSLRAGQRPDPFVLILPRGGGKSSSAEMAAVAVGCRRSRSYCLYVASTQHQADNHVQTIGAMLESIPHPQADGTIDYSSRVGFLYPEMADRSVSKYGNSRGWRRNRLWTASGFIVDAIGLDTASRGVKLEDQRPDLIILDDVDDRHDSTATTAKKVEAITEGIIPAGSADVATLAVQNLVHRDSVFAQLADGRADFLRRRTVIGPIPALRDFSIDADGTVHGTPTWEGQNLETCRAQVDDWGLRAFRREAQHEVTEAEGALWSRAQVGAMRAERPEAFKKGVVAVDPSGGDGPDNDECGIVAMERGYDDRGYCTADLSGRYAPEAWGRLAVQAAMDLGYFRITAERNFGGAMVEATISAAKDALAREGDPRASMVNMVVTTSSVGKRQRAEPVAALCGEPDDEASWSRSRLYFTGSYPKLEDELTGWVPDVTKQSPNRLDSYVFAATDLFPDVLGAGPPKRPTPVARRRRGSIMG